MPVRLPRLPPPEATPPAGLPATAEAACRAWYEAYGRSLYNFLRFHVSSADTAEDLTAEVFFRALRAFERFDPGLGTPRAWLFRIAQNALRDHQRQAGRRQTVSLTALRDLECAAPSPEERILWEEEVARLLQAMAELSSSDRAIVSLCYGSDLNMAEVAEILGLRPSAARTRLWRALNRLRKVLSQ
jgi:RNA polymerase sigma-70 factor, ECF subfamily